MIDKNWAVTHGANFVEISYIYNGRATALTPGCSYSVAMSAEGTEALIAELQEHVQAVKDSDR